MSQKGSRSLTELAEGLHRMARILEQAAIRGDELPHAMQVHVTITPAYSLAEKQSKLDAVDRFAAILEQPATWQRVTSGSEYAYYETGLNSPDAVWELRCHVHAKAPDPNEAIRAENELLRAKLAQIEAVAASARQPEPAPTLTVAERPNLLATPASVPVAGHDFDIDGDSRTGNRPEAKHYHTGGTHGGPGENAAECACGTTFAGFDTHAETLAALKQHIANPEPDVDPCPKGDPDCETGDDGSCHDGCEPPADGDAALPASSAPPFVLGPVKDEPGNAHVDEHALAGGAVRAEDVS